MREDYISWDEYFIGLAELSSKRSKDPNTQVGACIVNQDNKVVSIGFNGSPTGFDDEKLPWDVRKGPLSETKYAYVCHAELNAILNSTESLKNCRIYVSLFPCNECAKAIVQAGIKEVIYTCDKYCGTEENIASKKIFDECGINYHECEIKNKEIVLRLK